MDFAEAEQAARKLPRQPSGEDALLLEALHAQATLGDVSGKRPGFTDFAGRMRFDAWARLEGMSREEARRGYCALVERLLRAPGDG